MEKQIFVSEMATERRIAVHEDNKLVQEDLPFDKIKTDNKNKKKYLLPPIKLLLVSNTKKTNLNEQNENAKPDF